jgi:hypothetical protein
VAVAALSCALAASFFNLLFIAVAMFVSAATNALSKIALDSLIQRSVDESSRSSAFARSETFLQLAWVLGAAFGVGLSAETATSGAAGFWFATVVLIVVAVISGLRMRVIGRALRSGAAHPTDSPADKPGIAPNGPSSVTMRKNDAQQ